MVDRPNHLSAWLSAIEQKHTADIILGLERITVIAEQLKLTHFDCPVITVAGTNGKGSTVALLQQLYFTAGYRVGACFSPHLHHFTERVMINNQPVSEAALCQAFGAIANASMHCQLTFFEFITLAALWLFKKNALDVVILEVGLGGRLDAVNCVENTVAILTQVALDHCDRLGNDRESIGNEKAGIFRSNNIAICGDQDPPNSVVNKAAELNCSYYQLGVDFNFEQDGEACYWWAEGTRYEHCPAPKIPATSVACAIMSSHLLAKQLPIRSSHIIDALKNTVLPGRFQVVQGICPIIFDVAHNGAAAEFLAKKLRNFPNNGKTYAIFSLLADKDCDAVLAPMRDIVDEWHIFPLETSRAAKSTDIEQRIKVLFDHPCYNHAEVAILWQTLSKRLQPEDRVVVYGSFYTVAAAQNETRFKEYSWN